MQKTKKTVFVGMSGGVDSSVAAALLQEQGYNVVGIFMKNWSETGPGIAKCTTEEDFFEMRQVCQHLQIPYYTFNFESEYRDKVINYFFSEYKAGRTPNPDIMCNKEIKFGLFFQRALTLGADYIATGHYAQVGEVGEKVKNYRLLTSKDSFKDQTYFLYNLSQEQLARTLFPIGGYTKAQVRRLAAKFGLPNKDRKDSQGICFLGPVDVSEFLKTVIKPRAGKIINEEGVVIGEHPGAWFYTIGQRRVEGLSGQKYPHYVIGTDIKKNIVTVGPESSTYGHQLILEDLHLVDPSSMPVFHLSAKSRYTPEFTSGTLRKAQKTWSFTFDEPERALTPGQSLVLYDKGSCIGGGVIKSVIKTPSSEVIHK